MKKTLIVTAATAALAFAAPAFAQVTSDVTGTVQGQVTPQSVTDPVAQTAEDAQEAVTETTDEALPQAEGSVSADAALAAPPVAEAAVSADAATSPEELAEATASAEAAVVAPGAQANAETTMQAATDLPEQVQAAVDDGRYTTDDLNRAQLAALQAPTQGSR